MPDSPKKTPLYACHEEAGARLIDFAGWMMPERYSGIIEEHHAVRQDAGLFDVSHMGEVHVQGPDSLPFLQWLTPNDVAKLRPGRAHYSGLLTEEGTYIDDLLIYQLDVDDYLLVVNASNTDNDFAWIAKHAAEYPGCEVTNVSDDYALLALQGPKAPAILARLTDAAIDKIRYYRFVQTEVAGAPCLLSRTGYTGELGFEIYTAPDKAPAIWRALLDAGSEDGLKPAGLGARDTLRLEAGMALYGHEIDRETTPYEAQLGWVVKLDKGEFIGRGALAAQQERGIEKQLVGFEIVGRGIARQGHTVSHDGQDVGQVTSGTFAPTLEKAIGTAYVPPRLAAEGTEWTIAVKRRELTARVVALPFYSRG